jgi:hypothetical protein
VDTGSSGAHLQEHKKRQDAERQALGEAWREHGLVLASSIGTPVEPRNVNRRWDELRRAGGRAGLDWLRLRQDAADAMDELFGA